RALRCCAPTFSAVGGVRVVPGLLPLLAPLGVGVVGCGNDQLPPFPGRIPLDGEPLHDAAITFQPVRSEGKGNPGPGSGGFTDADGRYTLKVVGTETRGAVVGKHMVRITLVPPKSDPDDDRQKRYKQLPAKYSGNDT